MPTIGIGAGLHCDGQVLVLHDLLGLFDRFVPRFAKQYANLAGTISDAVSHFRQDVIESRFPEATHTYSIDQETERALLEL